MKIVVLAGGISTERAVSLVTGTGVCRALRENGHRAILVDLFLGLEKVPADLETLFDAPLRETGPVFGLLFFKPFFSGALLLDGILLLGCSGTKKRKTAAILYVLLLIGTAAGVVGVGGYLIFSCVVGDYKLIPWDYGIVAGAAVCLLLLIFAAVRAHKRAVALKKNAAEENGRTGQTPKSA